MAGKTRSSLLRVANANSYRTCLLAPHDFIFIFQHAQDLSEGRPVLHCHTDTRASMEKYQQLVVTIHASRVK